MNKATAHSEPLGRIETLELEITFTEAQVAKLKAAIACLEAECKKLEVSVEKEPKAFKRVSQKLAHAIEQAKCPKAATKVEMELHRSELRIILGLQGSAAPIPAPPGERLAK